MYKKLGEVRINKTDDRYEKIAKALEEAGFAIIVEFETSSDKHYIVAEEK